MKVCNGCGERQEIKLIKEKEKKITNKGGSGRIEYYYTEFAAKHKKDKGYQ